MSPASLLRLILLAALWGGSFYFLRALAPVFAPGPLILVRVGCAALFLTVMAIARRRRIELLRHGRHYLIMGLLNAALPFVLFAYAAHSLSASLLSILNACAPVFGALFAALWLRTGISRPTALGLLMGVCGVALLAGSDIGLPASGWAAPLVAGLAASASYGLATAYAKAVPDSATPFQNALGSMWAATLMLLPALWASPAPTGADAGHWLAALMLGVLSTGLAFLLYFRLIEDEGPTRALTVTFLIPLFGVLWGSLFLGEPVGWSLLTGGALILLGTALSTGLMQRAPASDRSSQAVTPREP
ncbi:MAG: DMT family transporter [Rhodocyclaceae bacterium]|nr:DMT family transporter [Rhodocyclaceae bacterium]